MTEMDETFDVRSYPEDELKAYLDQLEQRALAHRKPPDAPLGLATALEQYAKLQMRLASREVAAASAVFRQASLEVQESRFEPQAVIAKIRAQREYIRAKRAVESAARRSGIAFRCRERATGLAAIGKRVAMPPAPAVATVAEAYVPAEGDAQLHLEIHG